MKKQRKKPDPLAVINGNPKTLAQIEAIVGKGSMDFLREFQHRVNHKVSPNAVLTWLLDLQSNKQAVTLDNLARIRLERTAAVLKNSAPGSRVGKHFDKPRSHRLKIQTRPGDKDKSKLRQVGKAKKDGQNYGRPVRSPRPSAGISSIISVRRKEK